MVRLGRAFNTVSGILTPSGPIDEKEGCCIDVDIQILMTLSCQRFATKSAITIFVKSVLMDKSNSLS